MADAGEKSSVASCDEYESDGEVHIDLHGTESRKFQSASRIPHGIVISGEASESDDEIDSKHMHLPPSGSDYSLSETWSKQSAEAVDDSPRGDEPLKHNTLLHKKLREKNQLLRKSLIEKACQPYQAASKEIHCISQQLIKSQILVQEVTTTLRRLTNELFVLEDRVQSIKNGSFVPDIDVNAVPSFDSP